MLKKILNIRWHSQDGMHKAILVSIYIFVSGNMDHYLEVEYASNRSPNRDFLAIAAKLAWRQNLGL